LFLFYPRTEVLDCEEHKKKFSIGNLATWDFSPRINTADLSEIWNNMGLFSGTLKSLDAICLLNFNYLDFIGSRN
jgi:hypothetical protein